MDGLWVGAGVLVSGAGAGAGAGADVLLGDVSEWMWTCTRGVMKGPLERCSGLQGYTLEGLVFSRGCVGSGLWHWHWYSVLCASRSTWACVWGSGIEIELCRLELSRVVLEGTCLRDGWGGRDLLRFWSFL